MQKKIHYKKYLQLLQPLFFHNSMLLRSERTTIEDWEQLVTRYKSIGKNTITNIKNAIRHDKILLKLQAKHISNEYVTRFKDLPLYENYTL